MKLIWPQQTSKIIKLKWSQFIKDALYFCNRDLIEYLSSRNDLPVTQSSDWFKDNLAELCKQNYCDIIKKYRPYFTVPNNVLEFVFTTSAPFCNVDCLQTMHAAKLWPTSIQLSKHWKTENVVWLLQKGLISQQQCFDSLSKQTLQTIATHCLIQPDC